MAHLSAEEREGIAVYKCVLAARSKRCAPEGHVAPRSYVKSHKLMPALMACLTERKNRRVRAPAPLQRARWIACPRGTPSCGCAAGDERAVGGGHAGLEEVRRV